MPWDLWVVSPLLRERLAGLFKRKALECLLHQEARDGLDAAGLPVDGDLAVRARAARVIEQGAQVVNLGAAAQVVQHVINEVERVADGVAYAYLAPLSEIEDIGIQAVAHGLPLVLVDEGAWQDVRGHASFVQPGELRHERLAQRSERERVVQGSRHVEDAKLYGLEKGVRANVPPDFLGVVDNLCLYQRLDIRLKIGPGRHRLGDAAAWKWPPDHLAIRFQAGEATVPEGRVGRERQEVRYPGTQLVHERDGQFVALHAHVNVQAEEIGRAH